jgi:hypothetical protein
MGPKQRGMGLAGAFVAIVILILGALVTIKVVPAWIEYFSIKKVLGAMVSGGDMGASTIQDVRRAFDRRADIDSITAVRGRDLEVKREEGEFVAYFQYQVTVPLFGNASLMFDFAGNSKETSLLPHARRNE